MKLIVIAITISIVFVSILAILTWPIDPNSIVIITDKKEYVVGEPVTITMKNTGWHTLDSGSVPIGFSMYDANDNLIFSWIGPAAAIGRFHPGGEITKVWDQIDNSNDQVKPGIYTVKADDFGFKLPPSYSFKIKNE